MIKYAIKGEYGFVTVDGSSYSEELSDDICFYDSSEDAELNIIVSDERIVKIDISYKEVEE